MARTLDEIIAGFQKLAHGLAPMSMGSGAHGMAAPKPPPIAMGMGAPKVTAAPPPVSAPSPTMPAATAPSAPKSASFEYGALEAVKVAMRVGTTSPTGYKFDLNNDFLAALPEAVRPQAQTHADLVNQILQKHQGGGYAQNPEFSRQMVSLARLARTHTGYPKSASMADEMARDGIELAKKLQARGLVKNLRGNTLKDFYNHMDLSAIPKFSGGLHDASNALRTAPAPGMPSLPRPPVPQMGPPKLPGFTP